MRWDEIDRDAWEALAAHAPLQQTWCWGEVLVGAGARIERRVARAEANLPLALAQVATRRIGPLSVSLLSRGPLALGETASVPPNGLVRTMDSAAPRLLLVTSDSGSVSGAVRVVTPAWHAELDITPPPEELRRRLDPKLRNKVARAERAGLDIRRDDGSPARYAWLLDAEAVQQRDRRYRNWPPALVNSWHANGGEVRVYVARAGQGPMAAMLFLLHGRVATYHIGWAGPEGRGAAAHPLCLWRAIADLRAAGFERIDLGTVNTEDAPGLARFKIATGATVRPLGATYLVLPGLGRSGCSRVSTRAT